MSEKEKEIISNIMSGVNEMNDEQKREFMAFSEGFRQGVAVMGGRGKEE